MNARNFRAMLEARWAEGKFVCVGLDPDPTKFPAHLQRPSDDTLGIARSIDDFLEEIVLATHEIVCAFKPNMAFFEAHIGGEEALRYIITQINTIAPGVPIILDAKRGDIGHTNDGYVRFVFGRYCADAVTIHPYLGQSANQPFLDQKDKGIFVLCRTSNPGADEFQDFGGLPDGPLFLHIAKRVSQNWNANGNCGLVVGATYPGELEDVRGIVGDLPLLIPGIGAQGGDLEKTVLAGKDSRGRGMIINSSRAILYASAGEDFAEAARREAVKMHLDIQRILNPTPTAA